MDQTSSERPLPAYGERRDRNARLHSRFSKAWRAFRLRAATQVEPPGQSEADGIEGKEDGERDLRPARHRDRLAEAARDQITADGTDRADETDSRTALDARGFQRQRARRIALAA